MDGCFHCGLPLPDDELPPKLEVNGDERSFCCHGCHAVCSAIVDAGLSDYYSHRTESAATSRGEAIPDFLERVGLYDRPEIQKEFVTQSSDWKEANLLLENIRCPACLWLNERHLRSLEGVQDVYIDDVTQRARVRWDPELIRLSEILQAIAAIGYVAHPYDSSRSHHLQKLRRRRSTEKLFFAGAVGMLVMNFSLATYALGGPDATGQLPLWIEIGRWTTLILVTLILAYSGQEFFAGAWSDLKNKRLGMDVPVVLGMVTAYAGSLHATLTHAEDVYFDSIAMFVFFLLLARRFELKGKLLAADRLERLASIVPGTAVRIADDGTRCEVATDEIVQGDLIRLKPGETVPVDGMVTDGISSFDESLLTGEAVPVLKQIGNTVVAGSVNGDQPVTMSATSTLQASTLSEMRSLVEHGLEQRPRYALLAEQVATVFVGIILLLAAGTAWYWLQVDPALWLPSTIAVLIVTCPCALALATPVALTIGAGRMIGLGVLPLRLDTLDSLATCRHFVFDKTGTLTAGKTRLERVITAPGIDEQHVLRVAGSMSIDSEHPVSRALRQPGHERLSDVDQIENVPGAGMSAQFEGRTWRFGSIAFVEDASMTDALKTDMDALRDSGYTVSLLADDMTIVAIFAFSDPVRKGVQPMVSALQESGVEQFTILSGDTHASVSRLADQLGIKDAHGSLSPVDKLNWIARRHAEGRRVAMFGDGINDAPALAAADVSISFSDATDIANVSSDFLVLGTDASVVAQARKLAQRTRRNIMQNFAWAAAYNFTAVPFAAMGLIPPWGAAIGMSLSSLVVVDNALRLQSNGCGKNAGPVDHSYKPVGVVH